MAKKRRLTRLQKFMVVSLILCLAQGAFLYFYSDTNNLTSPKEALVTKSDVSLKKQVQFALNDFRMKNKKFPDSLAALVPNYFDALPIDPETKQPFSYRLENGKFFLGEGGSSSGKPAELSGESLKNVLNIINDETLKNRPPFDPEGKRDPFRPYDPQPSRGVDETREPLEAYALDELRLTAVIETGGEPSANIEGPDGAGYLVKKGMKIGQNKGEVVEILPDRIILLERSTDFAGQERNRKVELQIRTGGKLPASKGASTRR